MGNQKKPRRWGYYFIDKERTTIALPVPIITRSIARLDVPIKKGDTLEDVCNTLYVEPSSLFTWPLSERLPSGADVFQAVVRDGVRLYVKVETSMDFEYGG